MERTTKQQSLIAWTAVLALFLIAAAALSLFIASPGTIPAAAEAPVLETVTVNGQAAVEPVGTVTIDNGTTSYNWYKVETAGEFVYAATYSGEEVKRFLLTKDFLVTGNGAYSCNNNAVISGAIYDGDEEEGYDDDDKTVFCCKITYTPTNDYDHRSSGATGGLFGNFAGNISDVNFVFNGTLHAEGSVKYGAFAGILSGDVDNCSMASSGTVMLYGNDNDRTISGGGLFGELTGTVSNSSLTMTGIVDVRNFYINDEEDEESSQNNDAKDNKLYAGGIVGSGNGGGSITNTVINVYGTVTTADATKKDVLGFYNDDAAVFPAGGIVGMSENMTISKSTILFDGSTYSNGGKSTSLDGAISGGVCGYLTGSLFFSENVVTIGGNARITARSTRQNFVTVFNGNIHKGGIVGRKTGGGSFQHNVVNQQRDTGLMDGAIDGEDYGDNDYKGILLGSGSMVGWNSGNFWLLRNAGSFSQPLVQNGNGNTGILHYLNIYGGGGIQTTINNRQIRFDAKIATSPFHEWLSSIANNTKYTDQTYRDYDLVNGVMMQTDWFLPRGGLATSTTVNAVFLTKEINVAGNLVQFANEMNSGLNQNWVQVTLNNDITFEVGMPIISEFKGKFFGENHTITFNNGSTINGSSSNSNVGMFGKIASGAIVENFKVVFSGTMNAGTVTEEVIDIADINVGVITGYNEGTIDNVSLTLSQGGLIHSLSSVSANVGGIAGVSTTAINKSEVIIDGKFEVLSNTVNLGGVVGLTSSTSTFTNMNIVASGELLASLQGGDKSASLGGFAGKTTGATLNLNNVVITVKEISNFKNDVLRGLNATTCFIGAIAGVGSVTKVLNNTWLTASYDQYMGDGENDPGEKVIRLFDGDNSVYNANRIYINGGVVDCIMEIDAAEPEIRFSVPHDTSRVFTGWFINYNCSTMVGAEHLSGADFVPEGQSNAVFFTAVISSMVMSYDNLKTIAITTNAGQSYSGIEFILGTDITITAADEYIPIGTIENPFCGIFDGKSLNVHIQGGISTADNTMGLFGCIGEGGVVKQIQVTIDSDIGSEDEIYGGAIAAYNYGTIGQDSSSNKVIVNINKIVTGYVIGGIVGENYGVVKNVEVNFGQSIADHSKYGKITAKGLDSFVGSDSNGIGGGVIGLNREDGVLKNAIVRYDVIDSEFIESRIFGICFSGTAYVGGIIGYNSGALYSAVCEVELDVEGQQIASVLYSGDGNGVAATLVGYNETTSDIDAVWALYIQADTLALPNAEMPLITGKDAGESNKLIRYGSGNIETVIEDNNITQPYGGGITFRAITTDVAFYNYTSSLSTGELVSAFNGAAGISFSPTVTTATKPGLAGVTYYGVFVNTQITSSADFYAMAANVNNGFSAHANYILNIPTSTELRLFPSDEGYISIGYGNAFVGNFNGNSYLIRLYIDSDNPLENEGKALFGTVASTSVIQNFNYDVEVGIVLREGSSLGAATAAGFIADINYGQITNVVLRTYAVIEGNESESVDYAGCIAGYNDGVIKNTNVTFMFLNDLGNNYAGTIYGKNAGGIAGYNSGTIGSEYLDNVKVTVNYGALVPLIEGLINVGGIAGINDGTIQNTNTKLYGKLKATDISSYGGGVAGTNNMIIDSAVVRLFSTAALEISGSIGGVAGYNAASATIGKNGVVDGIIFVNEATMESSPAIPITCYGGIAAYNYGNIFGVVAEQSGITRANDYAGGVAAVSSGTIRNIVFVLKSAGRISANVTGGVVGLSSGNIYLADITLNGGVGRTTGVSKAGGIAGQITAGKIYNSLVYLTRDIAVASEGKKGLLAGESIADAGVNTWAYVYNDIRTLASSSALTGFNVLKIVGSDIVIGTLGSTGGISLRAMNTPNMWYSNISTQNQLGNMANNTFVPDTNLKNMLYHVSYYDLQIASESDLISMYQYVNTNDLFNGVMFKLMNNIEIKTALQPIGTEAKKFTGIFEGNYKTITFKKGGNIAGTAYSGLFGYASSESVIRNFIVQVDSDVILGGGTSTDAGVIAGKSEGIIENVGLNLQAIPYVSGVTMGGFAGEITGSAVIANCWAVIYNQSVPAVKEGGASGVNTLGVLGSGGLKMTFIDNRFFIEIDPSGINASAHFELFDDWYADISSRQLLTAAYGTVFRDSASNNVSFLPLTTLENLNITASFIGLDINDASEFINFANNINTYSDQGASFNLNASFVLNIADIEFEPVGTLEHPFTGTFNGNGHTITVIGDLLEKQNVYSGLFGYVESTAVISNLIILADYAARYEENPSEYNGQTIGDFRSIYSGFAVSILKGRLEQVIVVLQTETEIYNVNADSRGGIVGMVDKNAVMINCWVVLPEFYEILPVGGVLNGEESPAMPNVLIQCGVGGLSIRIENYLIGGITYKQIIFDAAKYEYGPDVYGFVDNKVVNDSLEPEGTLTAKSVDGWNNREMLVLYLNNTIGSYEDLKSLADTVNAGRNYKGVVYHQTSDITIGSDYVPIGGQIKISTGSVGSEYKIVEFAGGYNGNGKSITIPSTVTVSARYAGIFGIAGKDARISNLKIVGMGTVGNVEEDNVDYTRYAGFLIGVNYGATLKNIIVEMDKNAEVLARIEAGRFAGATVVTFDAIYEDETIIGWEGLDIAENCWVLSYNSRFNVLLNNAEQTFNDTIDDAIAAALLGGDDKLTVQGRYNGGINVLTVVAAGEFSCSFGGENVIQFINYNTANPAKEWYYYDESGVKQAIAIPDMDMYSAEKTLQGEIYYASFLEADIDSLEKLIALAEDTNAGYDLYGLTFNLMNDIVIDVNTYTAIGGDNGGFNATFDGNGNRITVANGVLIEGKYAGVFGNVGIDGRVINVIIEINGTLGKINYGSQTGKVKTVYAGAIAYTKGETRNVIVIGYNASLTYMLQDDSGEAGAGGIGIGYDDTNLVYNSWVITKASNTIPAYGRVNEAIGESSVNVMKVIGMGALQADFEYDEENEEYIIVMENDASIEDGRFHILGWYGDYSKDNQLSSTLGVSYYDSELGIYVPLTTGSDGAYKTNPGIINSRFEVLIMSTVITTVTQLVSIEADVNIGGYSFENLEFSLAADLDIYNAIKIGTETSPFKGTFTGAYNGAYYTITLLNGSPLFGYNQGIIRNMTVIVGSNIYEFGGTVGALVAYNHGIIESTLVVINNGTEVKGETVGGLSGLNAGTISNSSVIVKENALITASVYAGGLVGRNTGEIIGSTQTETTYWKQEREFYLEKILRRTGDESYEDYILTATVIIFGSIEADTDEEADTFAGGITGLSDGYALINRAIVRIADGASIVARGASVAVGGLAGRSRASLRNCVVYNEGEITAVDNGEGAIKLIYCGDFVGDISGSAINSWLVAPVPPAIIAVGNGYVSVNVLQISGNGELDMLIDSANSILFFDITEYGGAIIDGWYLNNNAPVTDKIGNSNKEEGTFRPNADIMGRIISVVYINTQLSTVQDIITMANTVNNGLYNDNILFTLQNDITFTNIDPLTVCIGTKDETGDYGFKHTFEGNGHTITFSNDSLISHTYLGLFGYVAGGAKIRNLNVVYVYSGSTANFGNINPNVQPVARFFGGIAGENGGTIENCSVTIGNNCRLNGVNVGGFVGINTASGRIINSSLTNSGTIRSEAYDAYNAYAGGIAGTNSGEISGIVEGGAVTCAVTHSGASLAEAVYAKAHGSGSAYAGGIAGSNTNTIETIDLTISRKVQSSSSVSCFAGGVAGSNTGNISRLYITLQSTAAIGNPDPGAAVNAGGIVGINVNKIFDMLVNINTTGVVADSAIGVHKDNSADKSNVKNVWVYNNGTSLNSKIAVVNNMTYSPSVAVSHSEKITEIIAEGIIIFYADLDENGRITMFQNMKDPAEVLLENISYQESPAKLVYTSNSSLKGISANAIIRRTFNSGTELKAFSFAYNSGVPSFDGEYSLGRDITLPAGEFIPIGTADIPFSGMLTFNGNYHKITVAENVVFDEFSSIFAYNEGSIINLAVEYKRTITGNKSGGIVVNNSTAFGKLERVAVYIAKGVTVSNPIAYLTDTANVDAWVISGNNMDAVTVGNNIYKVIVVNGDGSLQLDYSEEEYSMRFTALEKENVKFAGWGNATNIISQYPYFIAEEATLSKYSAEFLSAEIDSLDKLLVLNDLLMMQYDSSGEEFDITADFEIDITLDGFKGTMPFKGIIDGNGHKLTITVGANSIFGAAEGEINNIIFDHTAVAAPLFSGAATISLTNVIVLNNHQAANIASGSSVVFTPDKVFVVTTNNLTSTSEGVGIILTNGAAEILFEFTVSGINATAVESAGQVFAGWFGSGILQSGDFEISLVNDVDYQLIFINSAIGTKEEFLALAEAVSNNFTLENYIFTLNADIVIDSGFMQIGTELTAFKGTLDGAGYSVTVSDAAESLFMTLDGILVDIVVSYEGAFTAESVIAEAIGENSLLTRVVAKADGSAGFAVQTEGSLTNCWLVVTEAPEVIPSQAGLNTLVVGEVTLTSTCDGADLTFGIETVDNKFIVWYDSEGIALDIAEYDEYVSSSDSGVYMTVTSINEIKAAEELMYLSRAIAAGFDGDVTLGADIIMPASFTSVTGFTAAFDGKGYTIDFSQITESKTVFVNASSVIMNTIFAIDTDALVTLTIASGTGSVENSAVIVGGNASVAEALNADNVWLLSENTDIDSGFTGYMYHSNGTIEVTIDLINDEVDFDSSDNDGYYFMGYEIDDGVTVTRQFDTVYHGNTGGLSVTSYYAPKVIDTVEEWNLLAYAVNDMENKGSGMTFTLGTSITVDNTFDTINLFEGVLDGDYYSIVFADDSYGGAAEIVSVAVDGEIRNLALILNTYTDIELLPDAGVTNCWIIYYEEEAGIVITEEEDADYDPEEHILYTGGARLLQVSDGGFIQVGENEGLFLFTPQANTDDCYALREWSYRNGVEYTAFNDESGNAKVNYAPQLEESFNLKVWFDKKYKIEVIMEGVTAGAAYKPVVTPTAEYWQDHAEPVLIECTDRGNGYILWGFYYEGTPEIKTTTLTVDVGVLTDHIKIYASFEPFATEWVKAVYTGANITLTLAQEDTLLAYGCEINTTYKNGVDTPSLVSIDAGPELPFHVGSYTVEYRIFKDGLNIGFGVSGLEITPKTLYFAQLTIPRKTYDGTNTVIVNPYYELTGFVAADKTSDLDFRDVKFEYDSKNAGQRYVRVTADSKLNPASDSFTYINYRLDDSEKISIVNAGTGLPIRKVTAQIDRKPLAVSVNTQIIKYLDQYEDGYLPIFEPEAPDICVGDSIDWENVFKIVDNNATGAVRNAGEYAIGIINSLSEPNYIITLYNSDAKYIIEPSQIEVVLDPMTMHYGDTDTTLNYHITAEGYEDEELAEFRLNLEYDLGCGAELLPVYSEGEYGFVYSVMVKYLASNINFVLQNKAELDTQPDKFEFDSSNRRVYLLTTQNILQVTPREITVTANNAQNTKQFGATNEVYNGKLGSGTLAYSSHRLVISREEGERVNGTAYKSEGYRLYFAVYNGDTDVTAYYDIDEGDGYYYTITKTTVELALRSWGSSSYVYGDISTMSNMAYTPVFSRNVTMGSMFAASGATGTNYSFAGMGVTVRLGYFGSEILNVGRYTAAVNVSYAAGKEYLAECINFVSDAKNCSYEIIKRQVIVTLGDVSRYYNTSADISSAARIASTTGILAADDNKITVENAGFYRIGSSADSANAGTYNYSATLSLKASSSSYSYLLANYTLKVVNGKITINPISVNINVKVGIFEDGMFVPMKSGYYDSDLGEFIDENSMFFADKRAQVYFEIANINHANLRFLRDSFPSGATDREIQDIIISTLRLQYTNPWLLPVQTEKSYANASSLNSNVNANFTGAASGFYVWPVTLSITDAKGIIKLGEIRPTLIYTIIAKNEYDVVIGSMTVNGDTVTINTIPNMDYNYFLYTENVLKPEVKKTETEVEDEYKLEILINENGEWIPLSESSSNSATVEETMSPEAVFDITEESGAFAIIAKFIKENVILVSAIGAGLIVAIIIIIMLATAAARKRKLLAAATRELISKGASDIAPPEAESGETETTEAAEAEAETEDIESEAVSEDTDDESESAEGKSDNEDTVVDGGSENENADESEQEAETFAPEESVTQESENETDASVSEAEAPTEESGKTTKKSAKRAKKK